MPESPKRTVFFERFFGGKKFSPLSFERLKKMSALKSMGSVPAQATFDVAAKIHGDPGLWELAIKLPSGFERFFASGSGGRSHPHRSSA